MSDSTTTSSTAIVSGYTRTYVSGSSGLDTSALIEAAVEAKLAPAYDLQEDIEENEVTIAAYAEMQGYLSDMMDALDVLRNASGSTATDSVFDERAAYLTASDGTDPTDYIAVTVEDGTDNQTFSVEIDQLATVQKVGSTVQTSSDTALGYAGTFTLGTVDGASDTIEVTSDMSLEDIADAINDMEDTTGVRASVLQVADDQYMLVLATTETGQEISYSPDSGDDIGVALGLTDASGVFVDELQAAQNAIIQIDGVTVESSSNTIEDVLTGVTLDLYAIPDSGTSITVEVESNYSDVLDAIETFVDAYNTYREFALANQEVDSDGTIGDDATLFADSILRKANSEIYSALSTMIDETSLATIGITYDDSNYLEIDSDTLEEALVNDIDTIAALFEFQFDSSSSNLRVLADDGALASGSYQLDVTTDGSGNITGVSLDGDSTLFEFDGSVITGVDGTAFEGLKMVYTGTTSESITITISDGVADLLYDALDNVANATSGMLVDAIAALEEENTAKSEKVTSITNKAYDYEEYLIDYYAALETKISLAETTLSLLEAILDSNSDD